MRVLEHRRHSRRDPSGVHLNGEGLALARRVASTLGGFDRVVTSPKPRAIETAEALGFPHPEVRGELGEMPEEVGAGTLGEILAFRSFGDYLRAAQRSRAAREYSMGQASFWEEVVRALPEGGRALMISHGGIIEFGAVAAAPDAARSWGAPLSYLEGVRLAWEDGRWSLAELLRV